MRQEYEQMELDTRKQVDKAITRVTEDAIKEAGEMIAMCGEAPTDVRNRHEAYGVAAEQIVKINKATKAIQGDTVTLLGTLSDPNYPAIEAVSSICNSTLAAAAVLIKASAEMQRTLRNLYTAENLAHTGEATPMEEFVEGAMFAEAEPTEAEAAEEPAAEEAAATETENAGTTGKKKGRK